MPDRVRTGPRSCHTTQGIAALLGRAPVELDSNAVRPAIAGRTVLITGAGGSIGGALARKVATLAPARLGLLDQAEYGLWKIGQDLQETVPSTFPEPILADIRDAARLRSVMNDLRPDVVFHTAALKHVPIVEAHPVEGLLTNAIGTRHLADAAHESGARTMILVSTDKAVAPSSVMGASKRLAETYVQALDIAATQHRGRTFRCISLRSGNVLGSTGSVLEVFRRQIAHGGPITLTHPDMRRYIISPDDAVRLLLTAAKLGATERLIGGAILVPEMGEPIRILDLARHMIAMHPARGLHIQFTGPRPGEKLSELTRLETEPPHPTSDPALMAVCPHVPDLPLLARSLDELEAVCRSGDTHLALTLVSRLIPGFEPRFACSPGGPADRLRA